VAQVVEHLPSKHKAQTPIPTAKKLSKFKQDSMVDNFSEKAVEAPPKIMHSE
jgi:hypothetical protein